MLLVNTFIVVQLIYVGSNQARDSYHRISASVKANFTILASPFFLRGGAPSWMLFNIIMGTNGLSNMGLQNQGNPIGLTFKLNLQVNFTLEATKPSIAHPTPPRAEALAPSPLSRPSPIIIEPPPSLEATKPQPVSHKSQPLPVSRNPPVDFFTKIFLHEGED
jgi:hypothetical protein